MVLLLKYKYLVLFPLAVFEGPLVSLVVGFLLYKGLINFWLAFLILLLGDIIPDTIFYLIGYYGRETKFVQNRVLKTKFFTNHLNVIEKLWLEHGRKTMFLGKLAYGMAIFFLTSAGLVRMPFRKFISYAVPVSIFQYGLIVLIGYLLGNSYVVASGYISSVYYLLGIVVVVCIVVYYLLVKYARKKIVMLIEEEEREGLEVKNNLDKIMDKKKTISCIIPAHNEEKMIGNTLKAVLGVGDAILEIIVIDDNSSDKTFEIARTFSGIKLIRNEVNLGKSGAIIKGVENAIGEYVLLLDADLIGLSSQNIISLAAPIKNGVSEIVISMRANTPGWMKRLGFDSMSGERILPKGFILDNKKEMLNLRFGLEVFEDRLMIQNNIKFKSVLMSNVRNEMKWEKRKFWRGVWGEILMWRDLFKTVSVWEFISIHRKMGVLLVKDDVK